jgi:uncharacterized Fe-S cluster-containing radical SAM superfamily protein
MQSPPSSRLYNKADSIVELSGTRGDASVQAARVAALAARLDTLTLDSYRRTILERACRAIAGAVQAGEPAFGLKKQVVEELERVSDVDLPRYLHYRYRYEVFPVSREIDDFPPCVQIEPTSICNYRCVFCYQTDRNLTQGRNGHMGMMPLETFKRVVDELTGNVEAVTLASRGEPLMCRDIEAMLEYVSGRFLGLKINTNASLLTESKAHALLAADPNTLVFSCDAADPELYAKLRVNGKFDQVVENIRRFAEIKAKHYPNSQIITRVSGVRFSQDQDFESIRTFWDALVDQVAFVDYNPWESAYLAPDNGVSQPCSDLWRRTFVWWDGRIAPCDVDYLTHLQTGNVSEGGVSAAWRGEGYERLRRTHLDGGRQGLSPCKGCALL